MCLYDMIKWNGLILYSSVYVKSDCFLLFKDSLGTFFVLEAKNNVIMFCLSIDYSTGRTNDDYRRYILSILFDKIEGGIKV